MAGAKIGEVDGYSCYHCHGNTGYVFPDPEHGWIWFCKTQECLKNDIASQSKEKREVVKPVKDASRVFGLGSKYFNASLARWRATHDQIEIASRWLENPKNMLILTGSPGTGKTYFCMSVANYLMEKNKKCEYFNEKRFFEKIQTAMNFGKNQYETIRAISNAEFLIFDELFSCSYTEWKEEVLLDLIDQRYSNEFPTVFCTNLLDSEIKDKWKERIARRILAPENVKITLTEVYDKKTQ